MNSIRFSLRDYAAVIAILMVLVMTVLDVTLVNISLPVLATEFHIANSDTIWIVTAYQLAITMLILPLSAAGDMYSYRRNFLTGVVLFTLSSGMCAISGSFAMIVISRTLQGIGAACVMSVNIALTRLIYPREILGRGLALNAMVIAVATAAGPTIAGAILSVASWHWLFLINIPFGIAAYIIGRRLLPYNRPSYSRHGYDWLSALMNAVSFGLVFYSLGSIARKGDSVTAAILLAVGLAVGILYIRRQTGQPLPMLPVDLFRIRLYSLSICTSICSFIAQNLVMISLPFLFLDSFGFSEITTGLLMTPLPLATMIVSPVAARFVERHNPGLVAAAGMAIYGGGVLAIALLPAAGVQEWSIVWRMALCGLGFGMFQTPNNVVMVIATPLKRTGSAGGMQSTARLIGQTTGATTVTLLFALTATAGTPHGSVDFCLWLALGMAITAGILSFSRRNGIRDARG